MASSTNGLLVDSLMKIAEVAVPLLPFGAPGMIVARAALDSIKTAKETMGLSQDQLVAIEDSRSLLEQAVNDHAKRVAERLAG